MMLQPTMLRLLPQAQIIKAKEQTGVCVHGSALWAKDRLQAKLLLALQAAPKTLEELKLVTQSTRDGSAGAEYDALALADFILTFGVAIEDSAHRHTSGHL